MFCYVLYFKSTLTLGLWEDVHPLESHNIQGTHRWKFIKVWKNVCHMWLPLETAVDLGNPPSLIWSVGENYPTSSNSEHTQLQCKGLSTERCVSSRIFYFFIFYFLRSVTKKSWQFLSAKLPLGEIIMSSEKYFCFSLVVFKSCTVIPRIHLCCPPSCVASCSIKDVGKKSFQWLNTLKQGINKNVNEVEPEMCWGMPIAI